MQHHFCRKPTNFTEKLDVYFAHEQEHLKEHSSTTTMPPCSPFHNRKQLWRYDQPEMFIRRDDPVCRAVAADNPWSDPPLPYRFVPVWAPFGEVNPFGFGGGGRLATAPVGPWLWFLARVSQIEPWECSVAAGGTPLLFSLTKGPTGLNHNRFSPHKQQEGSFQLVFFLVSQCSQRILKVKIIYSIPFWEGTQSRMPA